MWQTLVSQWFALISPLGLLFFERLRTPWCTYCSAGMVGSSFKVEISRAFFVRLSLNSLIDFVDSFVCFVFSPCTAYMNIAHVLSLVQTCTVHTSVFSSSRVHLQSTYDPDNDSSTTAQEKATIVTLCPHIMFHLPA